MKKLIIIAFMMILTLGATTVFASESDLKPKATVENRISAEEMTRLTNRMEEIKNMDKSNMTSSEKRELRKESRSIKKEMHNRHGYVYIGGGTVLLIIIIIILI